MPNGPPLFPNSRAQAYGQSAFGLILLWLYPQLIPGWRILLFVVVVAFIARLRLSKATRTQKHQYIHPYQTRSKTRQRQRPTSILPPIKVPDIKLPVLKLPVIKLPATKLPVIKIPSIKIPLIKIPPIKPRRKYTKFLNTWKTFLRRIGRYKRLTITIKRGALNAFGTFRHFLSFQISLDILSIPLECVQSWLSQGLPFILVSLLHAFIAVLITLLQTPINMLQRIVLRHYHRWPWYGILASHFLSFTLFLTILFPTLDIYGSLVQFGIRVISEHPPWRGSGPKIIHIQI